MNSINLFSYIQLSRLTYILAPNDLRYQVQQGIETEIDRLDKIVLIPLRDQ